MHPATDILKRTKLNWGWKISDEQRLQIQIADFLREATFEGRLRGIWFAVPNEAKRHKIVALILRAMGMISGVADLVFISNNFAGVIELKTPTTYKISEKTGETIIDKRQGELSDNQQAFRAWCDKEGVKHAVCRSADEVNATLRHWRLLS